MNPAASFLRVLGSRCTAVKAFALCMSLGTSQAGVSQARFSQAEIPQMTTFPILRSIQFNILNQPQLQWLDPGNTGVYIQRYVTSEGRDYLKIDSLKNTTFYTDHSLSIHSGNIAYNLAPWIPQEGYPLSKHTSIGIMGKFSTCDHRIECRWSNYREEIYEGTARWNEVSYQLWGRILADSAAYATDPSPFSLWALASQYDTVLHASAPTSGPFYQIQIRAVNALGDTSSSPFLTIKHRYTYPPDLVRIDSVFHNAEAIVLDYEIQADTVETQWRLQLTHPNYTFSLPVLSSKRRINIPLPTELQNGDPILLEIQGLNLCGETTYRSTSVSTLRLRCEQWAQGYYLRWQTANSDSTLHYTLYRRLQEEAFTPVLTETSATEFTDALADRPEAPPIGSQTVCYRIQSRYPQGTTVTQGANVCVAPSHEVIFPNAIAPMENRVNARTGKARNLFEPVGNSIAGFQLLIIDKNGKIIYSGSAPWNGKINNNANFAVEGNYNYVCQIRFFDHRQKSYSGTLTVVY